MKREPALELTIVVLADNMMPSRPYPLKWCLGLVGASSVVALTWYTLKQWKKKSQLNSHWMTVQSQLREQIAANSRISMVNSEEEWAEIESRVAEILDMHPFVGFDIEWVSNQRHNAKPVSLMQLSFYNGRTVLLRINKFDVIPESLKSILMDSQIVKIGVGVFDDAKKLKEDYGLLVRGSLDLRHYVMTYRPGLKAKGLAGLASSFIGVKMDKDWRVRASNWEAEVLSERQIAYAANDAFVATHILLQIAFENLDLYSRGKEAENIEELSNHAYEIAKLYYGVPYRDKGPANLIKCKETNSSSSTARGASASSNTGTKYGKILPKKTKKVHNAKLIGPDDKPLCVCDTKKAMWYVNKELGVIVDRQSDDKGAPMTVKLNFEPVGSHEEAVREYHLLDITHVCVVCGEEKSYMRKYIVPHEYRKHIRSMMFAKKEIIHKFTKSVFFLCLEMKGDQDHRHLCLSSIWSKYNGFNMDMYMSVKQIIINYGTPGTKPTLVWHGFVGTCLYIF